MMNSPMADREDLQPTGKEHPMSLAQLKASCNEEKSLKDTNSTNIRRMFEAE